MHPLDEFAQNLTRRALLKGAGLGVGAMALASILQEETRAAPATVEDPLAPRRPHFAARAKHVIYLHMIGAPSQLDLFDHKPALLENDGKPCPEQLLHGKRFAFIGGEMTLAGSHYRFSQYGQNGQEISELLPNLAGIADDITILK